jgi:hypothetical protein
MNSIRSIIRIFCPSFCYCFKKSRLSAALCEEEDDYHDDHDDIDDAAQHALYNQHPPLQPPTTRLVHLVNQPYISEYTVL